ncbi:hypothetical protein NPIL_578271 [Nephila pilipes]|uniref:Uncharacterized protein n=1 Tax=Nephila pilipes TaxID=299642 RepID=A0A8X6TTB0_NEPPI|nr:hypothetical protein NPIL_578271 [Nephila pilipes]
MKGCRLLRCHAILHLEQRAGGRNADNYARSRHPEQDIPSRNIIHSDVASRNGRKSKHSVQDYIISKRSNEDEARTQKSWFNPWILLARCSHISGSKGTDPIKNPFDKRTSPYKDILWGNLDHQDSYIATLGIGS